MKRYTDINKTRNIFHNAAVIRGPITPSNPQKSYPYPYQPAPNYSAIKFYASIVIIIFLTSIYIYSESHHNKKSVFFAMRNIINLYLNQGVPNEMNNMDKNPFFVKQKQLEQNGLANNQHAWHNYPQPLPTTMPTPLPDVIKNQQTSQMNHPPAVLPKAVKNSPAKMPNAMSPNTQNIENHSTTPPSSPENTAQSLTTTPPNDASVALSHRHTSAETKSPKKIFVYLPLANKTMDKITFYPIVRAVSPKIKKLEYGNAIKYLIEEEVNQNNIHNFFNKKVKVKRAWVENDTLIIDFNRAFEYSQHGHLGLKIRIQQVLWTVLNLPKNLYDSKGLKNETPINYISFLIEGRRKSKIGGDGMVLNPFYSKEDLLSNVSIKH